MNEQSQSRQKHQILIGVITLLVIALLAQTLYLMKLKREHSASDPNAHLKPVTARKMIAHRMPAVPDEEAWNEWDPFEEMERMQDQMNKMFRHSLRRAMTLPDPSSAAGGLNSLFFEPDMDLQDQGDFYQITLDLPGLEKDQIKIDVTEHALTISGERKVEQQEENAQQGFYRAERSFGSFSRRIPLPADVAPENVTAAYEKGVLTVKIGKQKPEDNPAESSKVIPVQ